MTIKDPMIFWCFVFLVIFSWDFIKNIVKSFWIGCWHKDCKGIRVYRHADDYGPIDDYSYEYVYFTHYTIELECLQCGTRIKVLKKYHFDNPDFVKKEAEKILNKLKLFN
jgi:hypothetical protein